MDMVRSGDAAQEGEGPVDEPGPVRGCADDAGSLRTGGDTSRFQRRGGRRDKARMPPKRSATTEAARGPFHHREGGGWQLPKGGLKAEGDRGGW